MPQDAPQLGEVWSGSEQLVVVRLDRQTYFGVTHTGQEMAIPADSFKLLWKFERQSHPEACSRADCENPAWFRQAIQDGVANLCHEHINPNLWANFSGDPEFRATLLEWCPCGAESEYPGSMEAIRPEYVVNTCGKCRKDWAAFASNNSPESDVRLAENLQTFVSELEDKQLHVTVSIGREALKGLTKVVGTLGTPPRFLGIPLLASNGFGPFTAVVVGSEQNLRGVHQLGGPPDRFSEVERASKVYSNVSEGDVLPGQLWWHKRDFLRAYVVSILPPTDLRKEEAVKFRQDGVIDILLIKDFYHRYQQEQPAPPCRVGEEWEDTDGHLVQIVQLDDIGAIVQEAGKGSYFLPFGSFNRWRKVERNTLYDRLEADEVLDG